jgi:hypothetical protein
MVSAMMKSTLLTAIMMVEIAVLTLTQMTALTALVITRKIVY